MRWLCGYRNGEDRKPSELAFEVSHTKDSIHWAEDEEDQVQDALKEAAAEYREVARSTRKHLRMSSAAVQAAARALEEELRSAEMRDIVEADPPSEAAIAADDDALLAETDTSTFDFSAQWTAHGQSVQVIGVLDSTKSPNDPYVVSEATLPDRVIVIINMRHPYIGEIDENGLLNHFRHCTYDAVAEWKARNQVASIDPGTIRRLKDGILRVPFEIEMHDEA